jgi:hypothetical protein
MPSILQDPVVQNIFSDFTGPGEIAAALGRAIAANVPMESVWIPCGAAKAGSVEVEGPFTTLSLQLLGNNFPSDPGNTYTVTIGGTTFTSGDTATLDFINPNLPTGKGDESVTYTLGGAESATTVATGLTALINADANLKAVGITATSAAAVITINYPSIPPQWPATEGASSTNKPPQNTTVVLFSKTGTGNETGTVANASSGGTLGAPITTNSITALNTLPRWIKAQFTTLTGGVPGTPVTPWFHGSV